MNLDIMAHCIGVQTIKNNGKNDNCYNRGFYFHFLEVNKINSVRCSESIRIDITCCSSVKEHGRSKVTKKNIIYYNFGNVIYGVFQ